MFLCEALELIQKAEEGCYTTDFTKKVREVCLAEIEQELVLRGKKPNEDTCIKLARQKTGPLFALAGKVCGGENKDLSSALEESGYRIGTSYQLADDLLDIVGNEKDCGKTLGRDMKRGKFTLPRYVDSPQTVLNKISEISDSALDCLAQWPDIRKGLWFFIEHDLRPLFNHLSPGEKSVSC